MKLLRTVSVGERPISVCHHDDVTYVGNDKEFTIERITADGEVQKNFIKLDGYVSSLMISNDDIFVAVCASSTEEHKIKVFDLDGCSIRSWKRDDCGNYLNKLGICGDKVVMPNRKNKTLTVYSLDGQMIKSVPLPQINDNQVSMSAAGNNYVVISHHSSNTVFKVDINTGETLWSSKHVQLPQGIVCYRDRYVLLTKQGSSTTVYILDATTGKMLEISTLTISCMSL